MRVDDLENYFNLPPDPDEQQQIVGDPLDQNITLQDLGFQEALLPQDDQEHANDGDQQENKEPGEFANQEQGKLEEVGDIVLTFNDIKGCQQQSRCGVQVKSGTDGKMVIDTTIKGIMDYEPATTKYLRYSLIRENDPHVPVDLICTKHWIKNDQNKTNILRDLSGQGVLVDKDEHPSILFEISEQEWTRPTSIGLPGTINTTHKLFFTCNDSCVNTTMGHMVKTGSGKQMKEKK